MAPSESHNVRPKGNAEGVSGHQSFLAPHQPKGTAQTKRAFAPPQDPPMSGSKEVQHECKCRRQLRCHNKLSQCIRVMVGKGTCNRQEGRCPAATQTGKVCIHDDEAHGENSHVGSSARDSIRSSQKAIRWPQLRSIAFNCVSGKSWQLRWHLSALNISRSLQFGARGGALVPVEAPLCRGGGTGGGAPHI